MLPSVLQTGFCWSCPATEPAINRKALRRCCWSRQSERRCRCRQPNYLVLQELQVPEDWGNVSCMHNDGHGNVWAGFHSGAVGVWSRVQRRLTCTPLRCCESAVRRAPDQFNASLGAGAQLPSGFEPRLQPLMPASRRRVPGTAGAKLLRAQSYTTGVF